MKWIVAVLLVVAMTDPLNWQTQFGIGIRIF